MNLDEAKPREIAEEMKARMIDRYKMGYNDVPGMIMYRHDGNRTEWMIIRQDGILTEKNVLYIFPRNKTKAIRDRLLDMGILSVEMK